MSHEFVIICVSECAELDQAHVVAHVPCQSRFGHGLLGLSQHPGDQQERVGATQMGRRIGADQVPAALEKMRSIANGSARSEVYPDVDEFLQTAMDIRVFYEEAALGLTDQVPAARSTEAWFYQKTKTGALFHHLVDQLNKSGQADELGEAGVFYLVPPSQSQLLKGGAASWYKSPTAENSL